ncbi:hypothetical protein LTR62_005431 [Meristemomyces frigidus]|uniref:Uncharacterized protein n=1 Tax=Meristemomyces frigidus TaxID=1508187 RepID=A0AAN7YQX4_9PEZI|nr:hypothetical protein LTR62_005431 [Meristemomyces frigidus]
MGENMDIRLRFCNDFVGLPVTITNYNDLVTRDPAAPTGIFTTTTTTTTISYSNPSSFTLGSERRTPTALAEFADSLWEKMSEGLRRKVREACREVLRRMEDPEEEEKVAWGFRDGGDEDARFLD